MKSTAIALILAAILSGSSRGDAPVASASANSTTRGDPSAYLGKEADLIGGIVLRPAAAIVLLSEPCGAQRGYARARLFRYEPGKSAPTAERAGCYDRSDRKAATLVVYESDGTSIGKPILRLPAAEVFAPGKFFLPPAGATGNLQPRIVAVGESSTRHAGTTDYSALGLTRQPCPFDAAWLLARHIAEASSDDYRRCWQERGNSVAVRDVSLLQGAPPHLSRDEHLIDKSAFFAAATLATSPLKYAWSSR